MQHDQTKMLFLLQSELIESKIEMAVIKSISQVVEQMVALRQEMHTEIADLKDGMNMRFSSLEKDMSAVKERLGMRTQVHSELRNRFFDYSFKTGWFMLAIAVPGIISSLVLLVDSFT